ncbi:MAG: putative lipid II flippase FtsW [bacterium]
MNATGMTPARRGMNMDRGLLMVIAALTVIGVITVYSAGSERSMALYGSPHTMFLNQLSRAMLGFLLLLITAHVPYSIWNRLAWPAVGIASALLLMLFVSTHAVTSKGATRWLTLGPIRFQPSEIARYAAVIFIAAWAARKGQLMERMVDGIVVPLSVMGAMAALILLQPDFSTAALLIVTVMMILFISGARLSHMAMIFSPLSLIAFVAIWVSDYKRERILSFLAPFKDPTNANYQSLQSWIGLGRGGIFGVGLGGSRQKLFFLPDAHTDFIYSIVGEEWGLIGTVGLLVLFLILILRGFRIASRCQDPFGSYLAAGITFSIGLYALVNMGIAVGLLPSTGLPLPLISYGGTSLMMTLAALGIVLNISRYQSDRPVRAAAGRGR